MIEPPNRTIIATDLKQISDGGDDEESVMNCFVLMSLCLNFYIQIYNI